MNDLEKLRFDITNAGKVLPNLPLLALPVLDRIEAECDRLREAVRKLEPTLDHEQMRLLYQALDGTIEDSDSPPL